MAYVIYNSKKIQPAPLVSINKAYSRSEDGTIIGSLYNITLNGYIVPNKGSPNSSGVFWTAAGYPPDTSVTEDSMLAAILTKQEALLGLFDKNNQGLLLEIQPADGSTPLTCTPDIQNIEFIEDRWFNYCRYTINMTANTISPFSETFTEFIESASESWSIETDETPQGINLPYMFRATHSVSAKGKRRFDVPGVLTRQPWEEAKIWCLARLGYNSAIVQASGNVSIPSEYIPYNHLKTENIDVYGGAFSATESWVLTKYPYIEDFNISIQTSSQEGLTAVSIDGNIQGMMVVENNVVSSSKITNAQAYYDSISDTIFNRAQTYAGISLNPIALSSTQSKNIVAGTISYTREYNTRPTSVISGALYESISINFNNANDKFAAIPVLGRTDGPVLQPLGTSEAKTKSVSIECGFGPSFNRSDIKNSCVFPESKFTEIINILDPINNGARKSYKGQPQLLWEPITGRASYNQEWTGE